MNKKLLILLSGISLLNPMLIPAMEKEEYSTQKEYNIKSLKDLAMDVIVDNAEELYCFYDKYLLEELDYLPEECAIPLIQKLPQSYIDEHKNEIIDFIEHNRLTPKKLEALTVRLPKHDDNGYHSLTPFMQRIKKSNLKNGFYARELAWTKEIPDHLRQFLMAVKFARKGTIDIGTAKIIIDHFCNAKMNKDFLEIYCNYFPKEILQHNNKDIFILALLDENIDLAKYFESFERLVLVHFVGMKFIQLQIMQRKAAILSLSGNNELKYAARFAEDNLKLFIRDHVSDLKALTSADLQDHFEKKYNEVKTTLNIDDTGLGFFGIYPFKTAIENFVKKNITKKLNNSW
ncbi:MAG TPA: hypothetical protein PLU71_00035 [Candidatus Dependentiae bacterium]|nr:hypothetical protein [Candidatus Dependentiae bacterium]HRQ62231.1 hypothetical protein [Candidatus Dependentiae bacterium]